MNIQLLLPNPNSSNARHWRPSRSSLLPTAELLLMLSGVDADDHLEMDHLLANRPHTEQKAAPELVLIVINSFDKAEAFASADYFRQCHSHVCLWGEFAEEFPQACAAHADTLLIKPAPNIIATFIKDFKRGKARRLYVGSNASDT